MVPVTFTQVKMQMRWKFFHELPALRCRSAQVLSDKPVPERAVRHSLHQCCRHDAPRHRPQKLPGVEATGQVADDFAIFFRDPRCCRREVGVIPGQHVGKNFAVGEMPVDGRAGIGCIAANRAHCRPVARLILADNHCLVIHPRAILPIAPAIVESGKAESQITPRRQPFPAQIEPCPSPIKFEPSRK